jgi:hypothetical protein
MDVFGALISKAWPWDVLGQAVARHPVPSPPSRGFHFFVLHPP